MLTEVNSNFTNVHILNRFSRWMQLWPSANCFSSLQQSFGTLQKTSQISIKSTKASFYMKIDRLRYNEFEPFFPLIMVPHFDGRRRITWKIVISQSLLRRYPSCWGYRQSATTLSTLHLRKACDRPASGLCEGCMCVHRPGQHLHVSNSCESPSRVEATFDDYNHSWTAWNTD